jgi:hypothetical protein
VQIPSTLSAGIPGALCLDQVGYFGELKSTVVFIARAAKFTLQTVANPHEHLQGRYNVIGTQGFSVSLGRGDLARNL